MKYTFGTSNTASDRLYEISKFFNPHAYKFIKSFTEKKYSTGLDIGCGPGFTTSMLADAINSNKVWGLDKSDNFLSIATKAFPQFKFIKHDITDFPFPVSADVGYGRFILSHLKEPVILINKWAGELAGKGMLFIEEVEDIHTDTDVFKKYLKVNTEMIAEQGADLFVGKIIVDGKYNYKVLYNQSVKLHAPEWQAAAWFYPNTVSVWKENSFVRTRVSDKERKQISEGLLEIKESKTDKGSTFWFMRRMVIQKNESFYSY